MKPKTESLLLAIAVGIFVLAFITAVKSEECLTQSQARDRWPNRHLYWHTVNHCWDAKLRHNQRALVQAPTAIQPAPVSPRKYLYPLDANGGMRGPVEDYCCWPSLDALKALANGVEK